MDNHPTLPSYLLGEGREVIRLRNTVAELMESCQSISIELEAFIADLTSRTSIDKTDTEHNYVTDQPACLSKRFRTPFETCKTLFLHLLQVVSIIISLFLAGVSVLLP
jgi:hypothetical protein